MKRQYWLCLLCVGLLVAGCVPSASGPQGPQMVQPQVVPLTEDQITDDIKFVAAAVVERMRGKPESTGTVSFDPRGKHTVGEPDFHYEDFYLSGLALTAYKAVETRQGRQGRGYPDLPRSR